MPGMNDFMNAVQNRYNGGFQPYAAGNKRYGPEGRSAPNVGPVKNRGGYAARDQKAKMRREVMLKKLKNTQGGKEMRKENLRNQRPGNFRM